ncbi:MAG: hypothetical protein IJ840_07500 [Bacteroidales bacterium]|nr:hypothetical protein [Bacteroidales bacterium]
MSDALDLIHPRWVERYHLRGRESEVISLGAAELLSARRFDLFAKLFYVRNRKTRPLLARRVYYENLRVLVPSGKEWGKEKEKSSFAVHFKVFDSLIGSFGSGDFDPSVSIVPVGKDHVLMDGAHRVSTLAFYGKDVTVCSFPEVPSDEFPYSFFLENGMSRRSADLSALEGVRFVEGMCVLKVLPGGEEPDLDGCEVFYRRDLRLGRSGQVKFVFFVPGDGWSRCDRNHVETICGREAVARVSEEVLTWRGRWRSREVGALSFLIGYVFESVGDRVRTTRRFRARKKWVEGG